MLLAEQALVGLRLRGQQVQAAVTVFADEARRRSAAGLGAVDSRVVLTVLQDLPADLPVQLSSLEAHALRTLHGAPPGVVDLEDGQGIAVRRLVPAVRVELVLVHGLCGISPRGWDSAVRDASQFAPFCARGVVVSHSASGRRRRNSDAADDTDMDLLLLKARLYGVGVATQGPAGLRWLLEPAPYRPRRHSAAQWLFHEQAWHQLGSTWP
ncbi:hypothetical protein [Streptomyces panaciradicis]|uniref:hypothetical protein n=1 Tax=Streptomyces panaciradicis TaxID=1470261 RepID=UPI00201CE10A|nr:hypothetical protein [Streptomyces panaciradicis]MCL6669597.1 hypothetical protein [Streptomyces panaciradicis]